jgi:hypothetical protein
MFYLIALYEGLLRSRKGVNPCLCRTLDKSFEDGAAENSSRAGHNGGRHVDNGNFEGMGILFTALSDHQISTTIDWERSRAFFGGNDAKHRNASVIRIEMQRGDYLKYGVGLLFRSFGLHNLCSQQTN